ncbi:hypothetical protein HK102_009822, partial [Quaeritorhiza haematococci]
ESNYAVSYAENQPTFNAGTVASHITATRITKSLISKEFTRKYASSLSRFGPPSQSWDPKKNATTANSKLVIDSYACWSLRKQKRTRSFLRGSSTSPSPPPSKPSASQWTSTANPASNSSPPTSSSAKHPLVLNSINRRRSTFLWRNGL